MDPLTGILVGGGINLLGGLLGGSSTRSAQQEANRTNERIAAADRQAAIDSWLVSRGINPGTIAGLPGEAGGAVNTSLPLWASIGGLPAEQALLNRILGIDQRAQLGSAADAITVQNATAILEQMDPGTRGAIEAEAARQGVSAAEWYVGHTLQTGDPNIIQQFLNYAATGNPWEAPIIEADTASVVAPTGTPGGVIAPNPAALQDAALGTAASIFDGRLLEQELANLNPVLAAREAAAALQQDRINEARLASGNILSTELAALQGLRGERETGARSIYDADLLGAQAYEDATRQALQRVLAQQQANRIRQGFAGTSSGDALLRARTLASGYQGAAGQRTAAGTNLATRLAQAGESDALGRFQSESANATRLAQLLDADAKIASANAALQNAMDRMAVQNADITRRTGSLGLPGQLSTQGRQITSDTASQPYAELDALMARLSALGGSGSGPSVTPSARVDPVLSGGQIAGGAISAAGSALGDYFSTQQLIQALGANKAASTGPLSTSAQTTVNNAANLFSNNSIFGSN